ncbi:RHS repeat protein [Solimonas sp. K1W22B-7]|uniref:RHS repeat protein n=1 Tax=Solimonas sp. K1W22B-7 TaxID=2303331 RepID=UPI0013C4AA0C|nr:RHS repeat protein [Solimonas sp. K1W22B-7]
MRRWQTGGSACTAPEPELKVTQTPKTLCEAAAANPHRSNPVNCTTGRKIQKETDYADADFRMERSFASKLSSDTTAPEGWNFPRPQITITTVLSYDVAVFSYGSWRRAFIRDTGTTAWTSNRYDDGKLTQVSGLQVFKESSGTSYEFDSLGRLSARVEADGRRFNISYSSNGYGGQTETYTHAVTGRVYQIAYDASQHALEFVDPAGNHTTYAWDSLGRLESVTYPDDTPLVTTDNPVRQYLYEDSSFPQALTGIIDENGDRYATYAYDSSGRTVLSEHAGGAQRFTFDYLTGTTTRIREYFDATRYTESLMSFAAIADKPLRVTSLAYNSCPDCGLSSNTESYTYDSNGYLKTKVDKRGITTQYTFDATYGVETSRIEAQGTAQARYVETSWTTSGPLRSSAAADVVSGSYYYRFYNSYNSSGQITSNQDHASSSRQTDYGYDTSQRLITVNGPRTDVWDVTTLAYDSHSNVSQITNPLGHITQITHYDASGRPLRIVDPNGIITLLTYDARGKLLTRSTAGETIGFEYDKAGQLKKVTTPHGAWLSYTYDAAHRLTGIADQDGNRIAYTLDWAGNRTAEEVYDPGNTLRRSQTRVYDGLSRLKEVQGANGQVASYGYDGNGNVLTQTVDGRTATHEYDSLDRLLKVTDPDSGITQYGYNFRDVVNSVTDPRGLATTYTVNNLEQITQQQSPDTGTTGSITYDSADNLKTRTDAKSQAVAYSYDALSRVTQAAYASGPTITYTYDQGSYGKGHLTEISGPGVTLSWVYNAQGRLASKTQVVGARTLTTSYTYDSAGRLATQTLPSGKVLGYSWTSNRLTGMTLDGNPVTSNIAQEPFGPIAEWDFANGETVTRAFDQSGRMTDHSLGSISYDTADRITGLTHGGISQLTGSKTYGYDSLDRLTSYLGSSFSIGYSYDADGNRTQQSGTAGTIDYTSATTSNQLNSLTDGSTTQNFTYDANGSLTADGIHTYGYDKTGRLTSLDGTVSYAYNGLGQRVSKSTGIVYAYDEAGHLIGEYDASTGAAIQETVWMGDTPVAVVKGSSTYYVHADHLNTPRQIDDASGDPVWVWDTITFGSSAPDQDPLSTGTPFVYNLRHPGQVYEAESGLFQNWHRDYNPGLGRYVESDPIGLEGGISTYAYTLGSPIRFSDRTGQAIDADPFTPGPFAPWLVGTWVHERFAQYVRAQGFEANNTAQGLFERDRPDVFDRNRKNIWELKPLTCESGPGRGAALAQLGAYAAIANRTDPFWSAGRSSRLFPSGPVTLTDTFYNGATVRVTYFPDPVDTSGLVFYEWELVRSLVESLQSNKATSCGCERATAPMLSPIPLLIP